MPTRAPLALILVVAVTACAPATRRPHTEATSLLGRPLVATPLSPDTRTRLEQDLEAARRALAGAPNDPDKAVWLGRRTAYLGRYREAIAIYSRGLRAHPNEPRLLRHRGHRYISVRELDRALVDLHRAASALEGRPDEIEPDGMPNRHGIPRSTLQGNVWYHLALAHFLKGDFDQAAAGFGRALDVATNDDSVVASADWLYMALRRAGRHDEAARVLDRIRPEMEILENDAYHRRLLMYKGVVVPETLLADGSDDPVQIATQGFGVGHWYLLEGDREAARRAFERVLAGSSWSAFGYIAAEAELSRWADR
jgi:tetratricopeptide (TPR) repeat protein